MAKPKISNTTLNKPHHHHKSHDQAVVRLKRVTGHLQSVVTMIEEHKPCPSILQQLSAVISALNGCRVVLLQDHLETCLRTALKPSDQYLVEEIGRVIKQSIKV